jgi:hypothetical protein
MWGLPEECRRLGFGEFHFSGNPFIDPLVGNA